jgi:hypothetical protein
MSFSISDFTMNHKKRVSWWQQTIELRNAPSKPNSQKKHGCARPNLIRSSSLQAWGAKWSSMAEPSGTQHSIQINEDKHQSNLHLGARETLGLHFIPCQ